MLCCLCFILPLAVLSIGGVVFSAVIEGSEVTERGSEQLDVTADALTFVIDNEVGDITLETGDAGVIAVDYLKRAYGISRSQARSRLDDVTVRLEDAGEGAVRLTVDRPSGGFSLARVDSVDLNITRPREHRLRPGRERRRGRGADRRRGAGQPRGRAGERRRDRV